MDVKIRNIAILGHLQSGKTTLVESLYSITNKTEKGSVEKGTTISDYTVEEKSRKSSIKLSVVPIYYKDYKMNLLDVPGSDDFIGEAISAMNVVKGAVLVIDAQNGIEVQTIKHYNMLRKRNIPTIIYVNKMDKDGVNFEELMNEIRTTIGKNAIPFCYPMGHLDKFDGFVNCVTLTARKYNGVECVDAEIYPDKKAKVFELHNQMVEAVAETDESLLDKFFQGEPLSNEEIKTGLRNGVLNGDLIPVLVGSATKNIGLHTMLEMFINYLPNPNDLAPIKAKDKNNNEINVTTTNEEPFSALVFKTSVDSYSGITNLFKINSGTIKVGDQVIVSNTNKTITITQLYTPLGGKIIPVSKLEAGDIGALNKQDGIETSFTLSSPTNVIQFKNIEFPTSVYYKSLLTNSKNDDDKLSNVISKIKLEENSVEFKRNQETNQLLIGTLSLGHLNYILEKIKNSYKLDLKTDDVKVVYRETIKTRAAGLGRYVKQSGGSGFFGVVEMEFEPAKENCFTEEVFGGAVPKNYFPAIEKGFFEACEKGPLAGYPVIGVHAILKDGKYHPVDSNEVAFKNASILAFKDAYMKCNPILLEPIIKITVTVDSKYVGDIISDLSTRRAKISNMEFNSIGQQKVIALVPEANILEYVNDLKSITQGAGFFNREFYGYEEAPSDVKEKVLKENNN